MPARPGMSSSFKRTLMVAALVAAAVALPAVAHAAPAVPAGVSAGTWALDFGVPSFGKSGCLSCHGDPRLVVWKDNKATSYWVDEKIYDHSIHGKNNVTCADCHQDFNFKPPHFTGDWKRDAKQSCARADCHVKTNPRAAYEAGMHVAKPQNGQPDPKAAQKPLCGDCHGSHDIQDVKNDATARAALHTQAGQVCGKAGCHQDYWNSYNDYYHGAAYKRGATDAPACWDCHSYHTVLRAKDPQSPVSPAMLGSANSCGAAACHDGSGAAGYEKMIHGRGQITEGNPLRKILAGLLPWL